MAMVSVGGGRCKRVQQIALQRSAAVHVLNSVDFCLSSGPTPTPAPNSRSEGAPTPTQREFPPIYRSPNSVKREAQEGQIDGDRRKDLSPLR